MNFETINLIILICSFLGLVIFIFRKIPVLANLQIDSDERTEGNFLQKLKRILSGFKPFSLEIFLQKTISQIRVLSLKTDSKTSTWLQKLRKRNQKNKLEDGGYWEKIRISSSHSDNLDYPLRSERGDSDGDNQNKNLPSP